MESVTSAEHVHAPTQRFLTNTVLNFGGQALLLVLTFATAPYIVHRLGAELFGIVALVQTVAGFAGVLNLGIGRALTKYVSELYWKQDVDSINTLFQTAWTTSIVSGLVALLAVALPEKAIGRMLLRGGNTVEQVSTFAIYIAAVGLFSSVLMEGVSAIPNALQRFDLCNSIQVATGLVRTVGPVVVLALGFGVRAVLVVNLLSNFLAVVAFAIVSRRLVHGLKLTPGFCWPAFRRLFNFSLPLLLAAISALVVTRLDRFILAYFLPLAAVTYYALPYSLSEKLALGVRNVTSVVFPFASELHSRNAYSQVKELYVRSSKLLILVTLPVTVVLVAMAGPILRLWLGPEFQIKGATTLVLLAVATFLNAASAVPTVTALGIGRPWMPAFFAVAVSVMNVVGDILLIPRMGIDGAALAALLPQAVVVPLFLREVGRSLEVPFRTILAQVLLRPAACALAQFGFLLLVRNHIASLVTLAVVSAVSLVVFFALSYVVVIGSDERAIVRASLAKLRFRRAIVEATTAARG